MGCIACHFQNISTEQLSYGRRRRRGRTERKNEKERKNGIRLFSDFWILWMAT
ncbi:hypothetical protein LINGRAHAP2_LOCUS15816 [Linum grandiflorum]